MLENKVVVKEVLLCLNDQYLDLEILQRPKYLACRMILLGLY